MHQVTQSARLFTPLMGCNIIRCTLQRFWVLVKLLFIITDFFSNLAVQDILFFSQMSHINESEKVSTFLLLARRVPLIAYKALLHIQFPNGLQLTKIGIDLLAKSRLTMRFFFPLKSVRKCLNSICVLHSHKCLCLHHKKMSK